MYIYNSILQVGSGASSSDCIVVSGSGGIIMTDCEVYSVSSGHLINVSGTASMTLNRCMLENSSIAPAAPASLIKFTSSNQASVVALTTISTTRQSAAVELDAGKSLILANCIISVGGLGGNRFISGSVLPSPNAGIIYSNGQNSSGALYATGNSNVLVSTAAFIAF